MTTKQATQPAQAVALHVFRYDLNATPHISDLTGSTLNDFEQGLPAYLLSREYTLLPGLTPAIETYESLLAIERFLVVAHYSELVLLVYCSSLNAYTRFMQEYAASYSVWPALFMPEKTSVDNVFTIFPVVNKRITW